MLYRFRRALRTKRFDWQIRAVLDTPPLRLQEAPWCIVSMVANRDVRMYLLAIKSLYARLGAGRITAIVHADLPGSHRLLLEKHVPGIEILSRDTLGSGACQKGNLWERLVFVLERSATEYVIQMDADVLALGPLPEVLDCINRNAAFTLGDGSPLLTMVEAAEQARAANDRDYIGDVAESLFDRYPGAASLQYVRGSAGFAGFARGGFSRNGIERFHANMEALLGARWREWGTEQVGSNFAIANSPNPLVLPHPTYASFLPDVACANSRFIHFIGSHRFDRGYFAARAREVVAFLTSAEA